MCSQNDVEEWDAKRIWSLVAYTEYVLISPGTGRKFEVVASQLAPA